MLSLFRGLPGGAMKAGVGTSAVALDLSRFAGFAVAIWSEDEALWFCFAPTNADTTLVTAGDQVASDSTLVASPARKGVPEVRVVEASFPWLVVAHAASSGTVRVKPVLSCRY